MELWKNKASPVFEAFMMSMPTGALGGVVGFVVMGLEIGLWALTVVGAAVGMGTLFGLWWGRWATIFLSAAFTCGMFCARMVFLDGWKYGRDGPGGDLKTDVISAVAVWVLAGAAAGAVGWRVASGKRGNMKAITDDKPE